MYKSVMIDGRIARRLFGTKRKFLQTQEIPNNTKGSWYYQVFAEGKKLTAREAILLAGWIALNEFRNGLGYLPTQCQINVVGGSVFFTLSEGLANFSIEVKYLA